MVAGRGIDSRLLKKVAEVYDWLDAQIRESANLTGQCNACGRCCDFAEFDHRLFVTPPELIYLTAKLGAEYPKQMTTTRCPYNVGSKCCVYKYRFAGCRIFCCNADKDFQSRLSESVLEKLKSICAELRIPYRYANLAAALNSLAGV